MFRLQTISRQFVKASTEYRQFSTSCRKMADNILNSRKMEIRGWPIHYEFTGTGAETVFMMPGALGSTQTDFGPQLVKMDANKFKLVSWDPPGYGKSRPPNRDWPNDFFRRDAEFAAELIKSEFGPVTLMGWSDGGITALLFTTLYPELVNKLVVYGANAYMTDVDEPLIENIRDLSKWSEKMKVPYEQQYGKEHFPVLWNDWIDAYFWYLKHREGDICKKQVADINKPTLIIHEQKDALVPQYHPDYLHEKIKGSILVNWPEAKHNLHLRYPDNFNKLVTEFLTTGKVTDHCIP